MKAFILLFALLVLPSTLAWAADQQIELSLAATGTIEIDPEGRVHDYVLETKLAPAIASHIDRQVRQWRFEPILVDGRAVIAKTGLHLSLSAMPAADGYQLRVDNVHFGAADETARIVERKRLRYPDEALRARIGARVTLAIRIDEYGKVIDVHRYQTSLTVRARESQAARWREVFERSVTAAVRRWTFAPVEIIDGQPAAGSFIMPIEFRIVDNDGDGDDGTWRAYVPGPVRPASWAEEINVPEETESLGDGEIRSLSSRFRLKNDVVGTML